MKRPILFGTLATVAAIGVGVLMIPRPTLLRFNDLQVEEYEWKEIISTHKENPELNPGRILFGNIPLQLDADHNRLFFTIASDSAASLIPTVSLPREDQINMVSRESKLSIGKMSENEPIPVLIFTPQEYRVMDLVVTSLPIMNIDTLGSAEFSDDDSEAEIQLYSENTAIDSKTLIHLRGSTSYFLEKQSFKLSLMKENGKNNITKDKPFTFCSKDLSMIEYIDDMIKIGIKSFKIEGRMRSIYYIATVLYIYRRVLERIKSKTLTHEYIEYATNIINRVANRDSVSQFYRGLPTHNEQYYNGRIEESNQDFLGLVLDSDGKYLTLEVRNYFKLGDTVQVFGPNSREFEFTIDEILNEDNETIEICNHPKEIVKIRCSKPVEKMSIMRIKVFDILDEL